MKCKNCYTEFDSPYCPQCGQKSSVSSLTLNSLLKGLALNFGTVDRGVTRTLVDLFIRPGHMAIEYVYGKRVIYYAPFQLLFVLAAVSSVFNFWYGDTSEFSMAEGMEGLISVRAGELITKAINFMQNNRGILWAACIPIQAAIFRMLYKPLRYRFTLVEIYFIAAYFFSQIILVQLLFSIMMLEDRGYELLLLLLLLSYDIKQICGGSWIKNIMKCAFSQFLFGISLLLILIVIIIIGGLILGVDTEVLNSILDEV